MELQDIVKALRHVRFNPEDEKRLQEQMKQVFINKNIPFEKEHYLDKANHIDFLIAGSIGIEVKIKGSKDAIFKQCERYCQFETITSLILVTTKSLGMFNELHGKPVYVLNLNKAWL